MLYLIDLASVASTGKQTTGFKFIRYYYGPYDKDIRIIIDDMIAEKELDADVRYLSNGEPFLVYKMQNA